MAKNYALITGEPLTEFEQSVLRMLHDVAETGYTPKAMVGAILSDTEEVMTFYHNATMTDMMVAKCFLELDIMNDNILGNLPYYLEMAEKEGLIELYGDEDYDDEEECEDDDD